MLASQLAPLLAQIEVREQGSGATTCQGRNEGFCWDFAIDNIGDYVSPTVEHLILVGISVALGLVLAIGLAVLSHRRRWLIPVFVGSTGILYTIPSIALFLLLLPITGRGTTTAVIALTLYTLQIIYRNAVGGLANASAQAGMTEYRQPNATTSPVSKRASTASAPKTTPRWSGRRVATSTGTRLCSSASSTPSRPTSW